MDLDLIYEANIDLTKYNLDYDHSSILKEILDYYDENCNYKDDFIFTITRLMRSDLDRIRDDILNKRNLLFSVDKNDLNSTKEVITVHIYKL